MPAICPPGCSPCAGTLETFHLYGCGGNPNGPIASQTIVIKDSGGTTIATLTTDGTGTATATIAIGTAYTANVVRSRYVTAAQSFNVTGTPGTVNIVLAAASGFFCCNTCGPYPSTLFVTDANTTVTLTHTISQWVGSYVLSLPNTYDSAGGGTCGTFNVTITYRLLCNATGANNFRLRQEFAAFGPTCPGGASPRQTSDASSGTQFLRNFQDFMTSCVLPLSGTTTFPTSFFDSTSGLTVFVPVPGTITISE